MLRPVGLLIFLYLAAENINGEDNITRHIKKDTSVSTSDRNHPSQELIKRYIFTLVSNPIRVSNQSSFNTSDYSTFASDNIDSAQHTNLRTMAGKQNKIGLQMSKNNSISNIDSKNLNTTEADEVLRPLATGKSNDSNSESNPIDVKSTEKEIHQNKDDTGEIELVNRSFIEGEACPTGYIRVNGKCVKIV